MVSRLIMCIGCFDILHYDSEKIHAELGWSDRIKLEDGIDQTIAWYRERFKQIHYHSTEYKHIP